jgi:hypothetical protein
LKDEIEKKNQFTKRNKKNNKKIRIELDKTTYSKLELKDEIENESKFYKRTKNKNKYKKYKDRNVNTKKSKDNS